MKKAILTTLVILSLTFIIFGMTLTVSAGEIVEGECGAVNYDLRWSFDSQSGTLTISGEGVMANYYNEYAYGYGGPWYEYRDQITSIVIEEGVTTIGNYAFLNIKNVKELVIPDSVIEIGQYAFEGCTGLCRVDIGDGVQSIRDYAFHGCWNIYSLTLGNSLSNVGYGAFADCRLLVEVYDLAPLYLVQQSTNHEVGHSALSVYTEESAKSKIVVDDNGFVFYADDDKQNYFLLDYVGDKTDMVLPDYINNNAYAIKSCAFRNRTDLTSVKIPSTVKYIEPDAFVGSSVMDIDEYGVQYVEKWLIRCPVANTECVIRDDTVGLANESFKNCTALTEVVIPDSVKHIGNYSFENCRALKKVTIGNGVTRVGSWAFTRCVSLETVVVGSSVRSFGHESFSYCEALNGIYINDLANWCTISFDNLSYSNPLYYAGNLYLNGELVTVLDIPDTVESISKGASYGATCIKQVYIPTSVTEIGHSVFTSCDNIESIVLPFIGSNAQDTTQKFGYLFSGSENSGVPKSLVSVRLTACTQIPITAFSGCDRIQFVGLPDTLEVISSFAFSGCHSLYSIEIPESLTWINSDAFSGCYKLVEIYNLSSLNFSKGGTGNGQIALYAQNIYKYISDSNLVYNEDYVFYCDEESDKYILIAYRGSDSEIVLPSTVDDRVYSIHQFAFAHCDTLTSITIPEGITYIGDSAFYWCKNLVSVSIPSSIEYIGAGLFGEESLTFTKYNNALYAGNSSNPYLILVKAETTEITDSQINPNTEIIYNGAFAECYDLTEITIPEKVRVIGKNAFSSCYNLAEIYLPSSVTFVGESAFGGNSNLKEITIANGEAQIERYVVSGCTNLETISIGADQIKVFITDFEISPSVTKIIITSGEVLEERIFAPFTSLKTLILPDSISEIGDYILGTEYDLDFNEYKNAYYVGSESNPYMILVKMIDTTATEIDIHKSTKFISNEAFLNAESITDVVIPDSVTYIGRMAFACCSGIKTLKLGNGITVIDDHAFYACSSIVEVVIPDSVTEIGYQAFCNCTSLTNVTLGSSVAKIGGQAFANCQNVEEVYIPESVEYIGEHAFLKSDYDIEYIKVVSCSDISNVTIVDEITVFHHSYVYSFDEDSHSSKCKYCDAATPAENHAMGDGEITLEPTHVDAGHKTYICVCGYTVVDELEAIGHNWDGGYVEVYPTHTFEGVMVYSCECGAIKNETIDCLEKHEWGSGYVTTYPTHLQEGVLTFTCSCGEEYTESIEKLTDHTWGEPVTEKEATHLEEGIVTYTCACGQTLSETTERLYEEHNWDEGTVTVEPSHTSEGTKMFSCPCGESYTEVISRIEEHEFGTWESISETMHRRSCICGAVEEQEHSINGDACADCDYQIEVVSTEEPTLEHAKPEDGEVETDEPIKNDSQSGCSSSVSGVVVTLICGTLAFTTLFDKKKKR